MTKETRVTVYIENADGEKKIPVPVSNGEKKVKISSILAILDKEVGDCYKYSATICADDADVLVDAPIHYYATHLHIRIMNSKVTFEGGYRHRFFHLYIADSKVVSHGSSLIINSLGLIKVRGEVPIIEVIGNGLVIKDCPNLKLNYFRQCKNED